MNNTDIIKILSEIKTDDKKLKLQIEKAINIFSDDYVFSDVEYLTLYFRNVSSIDIDGHNTDLEYTRYVNDCDELGINPVTKTKFSRWICDNLKMMIISKYTEGTIKRFYVMRYL